LLHYLFAEKWVTSEWFVLTNVELEAVSSLCSDPIIAQVF